MAISFFFVIYVGCVLHAMWTDAFKMTISNWISIALIVAFSLFAIVNLTPASAALHIIVACGIFAVTFGCYIMHWMGAGDVKFLSALSAWIGPEHILSFLMNVAVLGGLLALIAVILRASAGSWTERFSVIQHAVNRSKSGYIPYAVPIGCAALIASGTVFPGLLPSTH